MILNNDNRNETVNLSYTVLLVVQPAWLDQVLCEHTVKVRDTQLGRDILSGITIATVLTGESVRLCEMLTYICTITTIFFSFKHCLGVTQYTIYSAGLEKWTSLNHHGLDNL